MMNRNFWYLRFFINKKRMFMVRTTVSSLSSHLWLHVQIRTYLVWFSNFQLVFKEWPLVFSL